MARHVTITGTRSVPAESALPTVFDAYLRPFATPDAHFYMGGALGIDTAALDWLAEHTRSALTVAVPCTVDDQPPTAAEAIRQWRDVSRLDEVVELQADRLGTTAYHARNRWMVDRSAFVIGFPQGTDRASGTWYTLSYAAERGMPRLIVPI